MKANIDFGRTASDYSRHRAGFPPALLAALRERHLALPGQRVHDMGTGTGSLARLLAGGGCQVGASDIAAPLLAEARRLDALAGVAIDYAEAAAEALSLADGELDLLTAGQCWHWFERSRVAAEAWRVLRPGGALLICHYDWLPLAGNVVAATESLIRRHNPAWQMHGGCGIYPQWFGDLAQAGFGGIQSFSFDTAEPYTAEAWRGRIRASAGVAASLDAEAVARFDAELAGMLRSDFPGEVLAIPHRVFAVWGVKPDDAA